jgi:flagella basal body P-ring formation protein FlgA
LKRIFAALILVSLTAQADVASIGGSSLKIRSYNRIFDGAKLTLLQVVDRDGLTADIEKKLSDVSLGDAPRLGEQRVYSNKAIAEAIRQSFTNKNLSIQIPHNVVVDNRGYQIDQETVTTELLAKWATLCPDCRIKIKNLQLPALPAQMSDRPWSIESDGKLPRGTFSQRLNVALQDGRSTVFWINGAVEIQRKVPVLNRSTPMSTRFSEDDFKLDWRDVTFATDTVPTAKEIVGQEAKFTMNANDIIWRGSLVREKAVQRGEIVRVVTGDDNWQVSMQAITEQDGFVGDTVNLRNMQTRKVISGKVVGSGEVEIR